MLAAGTLRCVDGRIAWISAKSGHYQPSARNMVTFLEFLRARGFPGANPQDMFIPPPPPGRPAG